MCRVFWYYRFMPHKDPIARKRYLKEYREKNRQYFRDAHNRWAKENPEKQAERERVYLSNPVNRLKKLARGKVFYAMRTGKLTRPDHCENCKMPCKPEADHEDYDKPLEVKWLCKTCHIEITMLRKNDILQT